MRKLILCASRRSVPKRLRHWRSNGSSDLRETSPSRAPAPPLRPPSAPRGSPTGSPPPTATKHVPPHLRRPESHLRRTGLRIVPKESAPRASPPERPAQIHAQPGQRRHPSIQEFLRPPAMIGMNHPHSHPHPIRTPGKHPRVSRGRQLRRPSAPLPTGRSAARTNRTPRPLRIAGIPDRAPPASEAPTCTP